jgi:4-hydroxybenzoate polyprenyltransferase
VRLRWYEALQGLAPAACGLLDGGGAAALRSESTAYFLLACLLHLLAIFAYNDVCDWQADQLNPRKDFARHAGRLAMRNTFLALLGGAFIASAFLPGRLIALLAGLQLLGLAYSTPGIRLKTAAPLAQAANFLVGAGLYVGGLLEAGGPVVSFAHAMGALYFGIIVTSGGLHSELMDFDADSRSGARTLSVRLGRQAAIRVTLLLQTLGIVCALFWRPTFAMGFLSLAALAGHLRLRMRLLADPHGRDSLLRFQKGYRRLFGILTFAAVATGW